MKKALIVLLGFAAFGCTHAQSLSVPKAAYNKFNNLYPNASKVTWEKEGANLYEAEFKVDDRETAVVFDQSGKHISTAIRIDQVELPMGARTHISKHTPGVIKKAKKIAYTDGKVEYEVEVKGKDYFFDESGQFVRWGDDEED